MIAGQLLSINHEVRVEYNFIRQFSKDDTPVKTFCKSDFNKLKRTILTYKILTYKA